ncbi:hypothetical protein [Mycolicibacterium sp. PDY-3]|uniref:hypothetical protein n=1 Tax=Mycolicibacterium sp. PDY-3 TaxID=3376069 RepID=UPI0037BBEDDD
MSNPTPSEQKHYIHISEDADRALYGNEYDLRLLMVDAKRRAVSLFKDDHDNGDIAIYQFIDDVVPIINSHIVSVLEQIKESIDQVQPDSDYSEVIDAAIAAHKQEGGKS